jgi:hypothetical protein
MCIFFWRGICRNGDSCAFGHYLIKEEVPVCPWGADCKYGMKCFRRHCDCTGPIFGKCSGRADADILERDGCGRVSDETHANDRSCGAENEPEDIDAEQPENSSTVVNACLDIPLPGSFREPLQCDKNPYDFGVEMDDLDAELDENSDDRKNDSILYEHTLTSSTYALSPSKKKKSKRKNSGTGKVSSPAAASANKTKNDREQVGVGISECMGQKQDLAETRGRLRGVLVRLHHMYLSQQVLPCSTDDKDTEKDNLAKVLEKMRADNKFAETCTDLEKLERKICRVKEKLRNMDGQLRRKKNGS